MAFSIAVTGIIAAGALIARRANPQRFTGAIAGNALYPVRPAVTASSSSAAGQRHRIAHAWPPGQLIRNVAKGIAIASYWR